MENREQQSSINNQANTPKPEVNPEKDQKNFGNTPNRPAEINPGKLDKEEIDLDKSGVGNTKGHEPYEFKGPESGKTLVGQGGYGTTENNSPDQESSKNSTGTQGGSSGSKENLH